MGSATTGAKSLWCCAVGFPWKWRAEVLRSGLLSGLSVALSVAQIITWTFQESEQCGVVYDLNNSAVGDESNISNVCSHSFLCKFARDPEGMCPRRNGSDNHSVLQAEKGQVTSTAGYCMNLNVRSATTLACERKCVLFLHLDTTIWIFLVNRSEYGLPRLYNDLCHEVIAGTLSCVGVVADNEHSTTDTWRYVPGGCAQLRRREMDKNVQEGERLHESSIGTRSHSAWFTLRPAQDNKQVYLTRSKTPHIFVSVSDRKILKSAVWQRSQFIENKTSSPYQTPSRYCPDLHLLLRRRRNLTYKQFVKAMKEISLKMYSEVDAC